MSKFIDCVCGNKVEKYYTHRFDELKEAPTKFYFTCDNCGQTYVEPAKPTIDLG